MYIKTYPPVLIEFPSNLAAVLTKRIQEAKENTMRGKHLNDVAMFNTPPMPSSLGSTAFLGHWSNPERIRIIENTDSIEFIYKQKSLIHLATHPPRPAAERVFKIVFSCKNGKWNKSEPIFGDIIPAQEETYKFE